MKIDIDLLKKICLTYGPTGHEGKINQVIADYVKPYADDIRTDTMGNLIVHKKGTGPKMMLAGHMDQIGFMVTHIDDKGFIRFSDVGGFDPFILVSRRVVFENGMQGIIRADRLEDFKAGFKRSLLYIDIGARCGDSAKEKVKVGDVAIYSADFYADDDKIMTPYLDDRVGCYIMLEVLKQVKAPKFDCYYVFTVQEEVGLRGAKTSAFHVDPDYGLAFDVGPSYDTPGALKYPSKMGGGACISIKDGTIIGQQKMTDYLVKIAEDNDIPYQFGIFDRGGTDAGAIHLNKSGVLTGCICVPTRYTHSDGEMCLMSDIAECIRLTSKVLETGI